MHLLDENSPIGCQTTNRYFDKQLKVCTEKFENSRVSLTVRIYQVKTLIMQQNCAYFT